MAESELVNYASPHLRLGMFYDDHPDGQMTPEVVKATEVGLPESWGGPSGYVVVVTLEWGGGGKRHRVTGYKAVPATVTEWEGPSGNRRSKQVPFQHEPEGLSKLQTNALGRALKAAGYAANTKDLKALMHWRQRKAEVAAIAEGLTLGSAGQVAADAALEAAGKPDEDHDEDEAAGDPQAGPQGGDSGPSDSGASSEAAKPEAPPGSTVAAEAPPTPGATPPEDPELIERRQELADKAEALGVTDKARAFLSDRYGAPHLKGLDGRQLGTFRAWLEAEERRQAKAGESKAPPAAAQRPAQPAAAAGGTDGAPPAAPAGNGSPGVPEGPPEVRAALEAYMELPAAWREDVDAKMAATSVTWDALTADQAQQLLDDVIPAARQF